MNHFSTPAGWYADGDGWERRWDGSSWTDERRRKNEPTQIRETPATAPEETVAPAEPPAPAAPAPQAAPQGPPPTAPPGAPPGYGHIPSLPSPSSPSSPSSWGTPPQGPPPGGRRTRRLGLWITLVVVLLVVVGTGITLAVLQPWDGGGGSADDPNDPDQPAKAAIQGDINGDGYGDARYYFYLDYDKVTKVEQISNGNGFTPEETPVEPSSEPEELYFDWDGDGVNEQLEWQFVASGKQVTLTSTDDEFPDDQSFTLSLSSLKEFGDPEVQVVSGDFDGDGDQDLAVASPNDRNVDISVLANDGTGTFADPALWLSLPNAVMDVLRLYPGDFDKDGDTDLWAQLPSERLDDEDYDGYYSGDRGYALLTSTGSKLEAGAVGSTGKYFQALLVGDVIGDGTASLVGIDTNSVDGTIEVKAYDVSSGTIQEVKGFTGTSKIGSRNLQGATLSDVDGDGKADVVFVVKGFTESKFSGVQVMTSTGAVFESALVWAETPTCQDDDCRIEFIGTSRY
ncbi:hypothetical protein BJ993_003094 [Nocardioides aromaticivorans]|uniref:DUF2510 domain-containing protein n=1 Tax=Nocardioides aromaticivorans TaxID=200618 RepID=A0A7Y9ZIB5_9ACTN|nr:DUF2510 domain-containing protein [Nocardioides aromaticivorans]NYI46014.1 hypothetical protein [Nocardioides aromaticivorans]